MIFNQNTKIKDDVVILNYVDGRYGRHINILLKYVNDLFYITKSFK